MDLPQPGKLDATHPRRSALPRVALAIVASLIGSGTLIVLFGEPSLSPGNADGSVTLPVAVLDAAGAPYAGEVTVTVEQRGFEPDGQASDSVRSESRTFTSAAGANEVTFVLVPPASIAGGGLGTRLAISITAEAPGGTGEGTDAEGTPCTYPLSRMGGESFTKTVRSGLALGKRQIRLEAEAGIHDFAGYMCSEGG